MTKRFVKDGNMSATEIAVFLKRPAHKSSETPPSCIRPDSTPIGSNLVPMGAKKGKFHFQIRVQG